ncbi:FeoB-associated Cys-rich membrane protein [bacterium]|nr:FeoB-associated Cys-rich membrane protein [bacterium]
MYQDIITLIIVFAAVSYALYSTLRALRPGKSSGCGDCGGCAAKREIRECMTSKTNNHVTGKYLFQF